MASYFSNDSEPEFLNVLSPPDKEQYKNLRNNFYENLNENNVITSFNDVLSVIKDYSVRNNADDGKRCNCCGVCWLPDKLGVNPNRLSYLTGQQKNNINSALLSLMYFPTTFTDELYQKIPELQGNTREQRMWTIRKLKVQTPDPIIRSGVMTRSQYNQHVFSSPKPNHLIIQTLYSQSWSYEDFSCTDDSNEKENGFFGDPFSIPLDSWQDDDE